MLIKKKLKNTPQAKVKKVFTYGIVNYLRKKRKKESFTYGCKHLEKQKVQQ